MTTSLSIHVDAIDDQTIQRFWDKVSRDDDGCFRWTREKNLKGYGRFLWKGQRYAAHRFVYAITRMSDPGELLVLHHCDNPGCVNPEHLFLGTARDNTIDMCRKGRHADFRGEASPSRVLTNEKVVAIRLACGHRKTQTAIAKEFGVHTATVSSIVRRETWRHI
jgi:hypothetical protein